MRLLGDHGATVWGDEEAPGQILTDDILLDRLVVAMAGLVAEREVLGR